MEEIIGETRLDKSTQTFFLQGDLEKLASTKNRPAVLTEPELTAVVSIEAELLKGARQYFDGHGFTEVVVPHITRITGACENIDTLFALDYFGEEGYLVQTGQLYLEALIPKLGNVYCVGPSFRAEPAVDERHLTEFTLVEFEFPGGFDELLIHIENTVHAMVQRAIHYRKAELEFLGVDMNKLKKVKTPFRRITYTEAIEQLKEKGVSVSWGDDLKSHHEAMIVADGVPTFITHYPEAIKFFNMRRNPENPLVVNSSDLILPHSGEAVGSAEREFDHELLRGKLLKSEMYRKLTARGKSISDFEWYFDLIKQNPMQHAGCGIGLNRVTQFVLGTSDIRATTAYPMNLESLL
jgi:asparaginyl-tRNA synthetase